MLLFFLWSYVDHIFAYAAVCPLGILFSTIGTRVSVPPLIQDPTPCVRQPNLLANALSHTGLCCVFIKPRQVRDFPVSSQSTLFVILGSIVYFSIWFHSASLCQVLVTLRINTLFASCVQGNCGKAGICCFIIGFLRFGTL